MASVPAVVVAVLAAGQSRRFGDAEKLHAEFRGMPLWQHGIRALSELPFAERLLVVSEENHDVPEGFSRIVNACADEGIGTSLALVAQHAARTGSDALLVALADMPLVPKSHFADLIERAAPDALLASHNGAATTPPALFGREHFTVLQSAGGDTGARALLRSAEVVPCDPAWLIDIDTPEDLHRHD